MDGAVKNKKMKCYDCKFWYVKELSMYHEYHGSPGGRHSCTLGACGNEENKDHYQHYLSGLHTCEQGEGKPA